jgi:amino acid adenylation domain-containing protein
MTMLLQHGVMAQAEARPDATAIVFKGGRTSYRELEEDSNRLANALQESGCVPGDRVAILMPKMPAAVVAMLGVLKAGCCYVPLDPADAPARLSRILETADCACILAAGHVGPVLRNIISAASLLRAPRLGWLDAEPAADTDPNVAFTFSDLQGMSAAPLHCAADGDDIAHMLFTSGSTGTPKGVMIRHRNVLHFIRWASSYFGISPNDRISQHPPLRFDVSTFDVFGALWAGAELHLVPRELNLLPHRLAGFMREAGLTQWFSVPSVLNLMAKFDVVMQDDFPELRRVLFAGEVLPTPTLQYWMRRLPHVSFSNLYGPTETTISSSYYTLPACPQDAGQAIPIGRACDGEQLLLLDAELQPITTPDTEGDLYISGQGVTAGYWRDEEKTRKAFIEYGDSTIYRTGDRAKFDAHGLFYFIGRADAQIKTRGYRIELGEIETALNSIDGLRESIVVAINSDGFEGATICCAYATADTEALTVNELRRLLAEKIPAYMIPVRWKSYEMLPKNANGKFDRPKIADDFKELVACDAAPEGARAAAGT